jgi:hypothetical protein
MEWPSSVDPAWFGPDSFGYSQDKHQIQAQSVDLAILLEHFWIH